jgi:CDP-diglyceride synthetase
MEVDINSVPIASLFRLFGVLLLGGIILCVPLFKFNLRKFAGSSLFVKILFWIPIFLIFVTVLYMNGPEQELVLDVLLIAALVEVSRRWHKPANRVTLGVYFFIFTYGLAHLAILKLTNPLRFTNILITLVTASVLADVAAFFLGNYLGRHKLPRFLNEQKSWEGVFGQVAGALIGIALVNAFVEPVITMWLFLPIGLGSALGDLANSFVKRRLGIKDWSRAIPGHGGFIDRLSSLSGSALLTFYFLRLGGF